MGDLRADPAGDRRGVSGDEVRVESISAITLATHDMPGAVAFYDALGFALRDGGATAAFTSYHAGPSYLNLALAGAEFRPGWWGRAIFYVADVDAVYRRVLAHGFAPDTVPRDAEWGERYFHVTDPDGHQLSFARPLDRR